MEFGEDFKTPEELLEYARTHSRTERALFHKDHVKKIYELAGKELPLLHEVMPDFIVMREESMDNLISAAYAKLQKQHPRQATDGDWDCKNCGWTNSGLRTKECRNCSAVAPSPEPKPEIPTTEMVLTAIVEWQIKVNLTGSINVHDQLLVPRAAIEDAVKTAMLELTRKLGPDYELCVGKVSSPEEHVSAFAEHPYTELGELKIVHGKIAPVMPEPGDDGYLEACAEGGGVTNEEFEEHMRQAALPDSDPRKRD